MDKILIKDLLVRCIIGVREEERRDKQDVIINVTLYVDLKKPAASDSLDDAVDYSTLNKRIIGMVEKSSFNLMEAAAERIADLCLENPDVRQVTVEVEKPSALRFARSAGVEITRTR